MWSPPDYVLIPKRNFSTKARDNDRIVDSQRRQVFRHALEPSLKWFGRKNDLAIVRIFDPAIYSRAVHECEN